MSPAARFFSGASLVLFFVVGWSCATSEEAPFGPGSSDGAGDNTGGSGGSGEGGSATASSTGSSSDGGAGTSSSASSSVSSSASTATASSSSSGGGMCDPQNCLLMCFMQDPPGLGMCQGSMCVCTGLDFDGGLPDGFDFDGGLPDGFL